MKSIRKFYFYVSFICEPKLDQQSSKGKLDKVGGVGSGV